MTERTYGRLEWTLKQIEDSFSGGDLRDMAAHIRELQAKVDRLKEDVEVWENCYESCNETREILISEYQKLKAERREFGMRVARSAYKSLNYIAYDEDIAAIVEQELAK